MSPEVPSPPPVIAETAAVEPTLIDLVQELRATLGLFDGAMAIPPKLAWEDALAEVRRLRRYWLNSLDVGTDRDLSAKEQRRLIQDCAHWAGRAERAEAEAWRLRAALYKIAEDAEVAHQGGIHGERCRCGHVRTSHGEVITRCTICPCDQFDGEDHG